MIPFLKFYPACEPLEESFTNRITYNKASVNGRYVQELKQLTHVSLDLIFIRVGE